MAVVTAARLIWVNTTLGDRHTNIICVLVFAAAVLREPSVAQFLSPLLPPAVVFDAWYVLFLFGVVQCVMLFQLSGHRQVRYAQSVRIWLCSGFVAVIMLMLSGYARGSGTEIWNRDHWTSAAYFALYAAAIAAVCLYSCTQVPRLWRRATRWRERLAVGLIAGVGLFGSIDVSIFALGAISEVAGWQSWIAAGTTFRMSGEPLVLFGGAAFLTLVASAVSGVMRGMRMDAISRNVEALEPVWRDLTDAAPGVVLQLAFRDRLGATPKERWMRRPQEIEDALVVVSGYVHPLPEELDLAIDEWPDDGDAEVLRSVAELVVATRYMVETPPQSRIRGSLAVAMQSMSIEDLRRWWPIAKDLVAHRSLHLEES
ncbi:MAG: hypothetical protein GX542_02575 [Rhodococcus sp.]|nr:hypothetical protein [Rhodococcus sp. (in: high G+C Gram-positive bacteria)]